LPSNSPTVQSLKKKLNAVQLSARKEERNNNNNTLDRQTLDSSGALYVKSTYSAQVVLLCTRRNIPIRKEESETGTCPFDSIERAIKQVSSSHICRFDFNSCVSLSDRAQSKNLKHNNENCSYINQEIQTSDV